MMAVSIRPAVQADLPTLLCMAESFVRESGHGFTFDPAAAAKSLRALLGFGRARLVVAVAGGEVQGGFALQYERSFTVETWGYLQLFYVRAGARGTMAGRRLAAAVVAEAEQAGVSRLFASATGGLSRTATGHFINLMGKVGFETAGPVLMRRM